MKIGILTYFSAHNYGAFLQAYALQKVISSFLNCEVELINYRSPKELEFYRHVSILPPKSIFNFFSTLPFRLSEKRFYRNRFKCFEKAVRDYQIASEKSLISSSIQEFNKAFENDYDLIVAGSDEIWKLDSFRGFPNAYWLPDTRCKKVSFAASSRTRLSDISSETALRVEVLLKSFEYIGVRDDITRAFIESFNSGKGKCFVNCDPTFLYDFHPNPARGKEILRNKFKVRRRKKTIGLMLGEVALAQDIVKMYGDKFEFVSLYHYSPRAKKCPNLNPFEWVDVISALDGVITTFFHACVFSLKSNTKFLAIDNRSDDVFESKIYDLLSRNKIAEGRFVTYSDKERYDIVLKNVGPFLADTLSDSTVSFTKVCVDEKKRAESFFRYLNLVDHRTVADLDERDCCGCGLCSYICPAKAIKMELNDEGFYKPAVEAEKCVHCGLCQKHCANNDDWGGSRTFKNIPLAYGLKHKSEDVRMHSRSGGAFTMLSDYVLNNNGVVYGAAFCDGMNVKHIRATNRVDRDKMRGSKYVQSPIFHLFSMIEMDLKTGRLVMFTGTPCQNAAIKKRFSDLYSESLILVDILCHGVPGINVWKDYISICENEHKGTVEKFDFRNKQDFGWWEHVESYWINEKRYDSREYTGLFYKHVILDRSCSYCRFKSVERVSDFTLGDFWGIDKAIPGFDDNKGVSLLLVNSDKGKSVFEAVRSDAIIQPVPIENCIQNSMKQPYPEPVSRERFWKVYQEKGLAKTFEMYRRQKAVSNIRSIPRRTVRKGKGILKRLMIGKG